MFDSGGGFVGPPGEFHFEFRVPDAVELELEFEFHRPADGERERPLAGRQRGFVDVTELFTRVGQKLPRLVRVESVSLFELAPGANQRPVVVRLGRRLGLPQRVFTE